MEEKEPRSASVSEILKALNDIWFILLGILVGMAILIYISKPATARADLTTSPGAVVCEDDHQAFRYALGDDVKQKVMRVVQRCWRVGTLDGPTSTSRLEDLLDGGEDDDQSEDAP